MSSRGFQESNCAIGEFARPPRVFSRYTTLCTAPETREAEGARALRVSSDMKNFAVDGMDSAK